MDRKSFARQLRHRSTDAERRLWSKLRDRRLGGCKFRRQHPIGPYIADFVCTESYLIVELDGGQHFSRQKRYDQARDAWLAQQGYRVLRFPDNVVLKEVESVLQVIWRAQQLPDGDFNGAHETASPSVPLTRLKPPSPPLGERELPT
jgi:very-short-patch-repair endonuclease